MARQTPPEWEAQFANPDRGDIATVVTVTHRYHGVKQFFLTIEEFQPNIKSLMMPYWVDGFTIVIENL